MMKKIGFVLLIVMVIIVSTGCGEHKTTVNSSSVITSVEDISEIGGK